MPLDKSGSKESVGNNIRAERDSGKPQKQAVAIALDVARRARRADGGNVVSLPIAPHVVQNNRERGAFLAQHMNPGSEKDNVVPLATVPRKADGGKVIRFPAEKARPHSPEAEQFGRSMDQISGNNPVIQFPNVPRKADGGKVTQLNLWANAPPLSNKLGGSEPSSGNKENVIRLPTVPKRADGGNVIDRSQQFADAQKTNRHNNAGGFRQGTPSANIIQLPNVPHRDDGGSVPWFVRNEARNINTTGALHSPVPGRTDHLPVNVPPGSYVLPADLVSGIGQGNTTSGIQSLNSMFFGSGPLGVKPMKGGRGKGPPRAKIPRAPKFADGGLAGADMSAEPMQPMQDQVPEQGAGQENQEGVPIMAAGGEFIIPPHKVAEIGGGDVNIGHDILDMFVQDMRKDLIKTLSKLPGPAKD